jgi:hypothetical protein
VWKKRERDWPCKERPVFFGRVDELAGSTRLPRSKECSQEHLPKSGPWSTKADLCLDALVPVPSLTGDKIATALIDPPGGLGPRKGHLPW